MAYIDKYGVEFSDDKKELRRVPVNYSGVYEIPEGTEYVDLCSFKGCSQITAIVVPSSVISFGEDEYYGEEDVNLLASCKKMAYFFVDSQNKEYYSIEGVLCRKSDHLIIAYPFAKKDIFVLPDNLLLTTGEEYVDDGALWLSPYILTRIQVQETNPNYILKDGALYNKCMGKLIRVSPYTTSYIMPDQVERIANCAFLGCTKLTEIHLGESLLDISCYDLNLQDQLCDCKAVRKLTVHEDNKYFSNDEKGFVYQHDYDFSSVRWLIYFPPAKRTKNCLLPDIDFIDSCAFANCSHIENFTFGNYPYVNHIFKDAFKDTAFYLNKENWKDGILYID